MEPRIGWELALASLVLSFGLSLLVAWTYAVTHAALSYQRSFTQSLALAGPIAAVLMLAIGDDVARGLGVVGALAFVRFRANLKDTRDLVFVFASLALGVASGVNAYGAAVLGAGLFVLATFLMRVTDFGSVRRFDAVLRLRADTQRLEEGALGAVLGKRCHRAALVNLRDAGAHEQEHVYQLELGSGDVREALVGELSKLAGVSGVALVMQEALVDP